MNATAIALRDSAVARGEPGLTRGGRVGGHSRPRAAGLWRAAGPAVLVAVGYVDPGNWGTDLSAGSRYGYRLLWVLVVANAIALLLQYLSARIGLETGVDLATQLRRRLPRAVHLPVWILLECGMLLTELAELLGVVVALRLLFGLPLLPAVVLGAAAVAGLLLVGGRNQRRVELLVLAMLGVVAAAYVVELVFAAPGAQVVAGLAPELPTAALPVAAGMIGATVMPHNLILHSRSVLSRRDEPSAARDATITTAVALNVALVVNVAMLVVAGTVLHAQPVATLGQAHDALGVLLGRLPAGLFAIGLLAAGLGAAVTGGVAGQYVTDAFLPWSPPLLARRLLTLVPAAVVLAAGVPEITVLVWSQAGLCLLLPVVVWPLVLLTRSRGAVRAAGIAVAVLLTALDVWVCAGIGS